MKNNLLILIITLCLFGCKNNSKNNHPSGDSLKKDTVAITTIVKDTTAIKSEDSVSNVGVSQADSVNFEKFSIEATPNLVKAPIDWSSYPKAKDFKIRIADAYKTNKIGFAGHYVLSIFGCGASCLMGFMVDVRDGKIYDLPLGEENSCLFAEDRAICKTNSRLFISSICKEKLESTKVYYLAYLWNEEKKDFTSMKKEEDFLKK